MFDAVIIGQGLAGTAMAWELIRRGCRIAIVDPDEAQTCSRVAAGLVTPLTGGRATLSWRFDETWADAHRHYAEAERRLATPFWSVGASVRLYASDAQRADFEARFADWPEVTVRSASPWPGLPGQIMAPHGAFAMSPAARLDTKTYLSASRAYFERHAVVIAAQHDWGRPLAQHGLSARAVISCEGVAARRSAPFARLNLHPARGTILTVKIAGLGLTHVLHASAWLVPAQEPDHYLLGATFEREGGPAADPGRGRAELMSRLREFVDAPFEVVAETSAVRPASYDKHPLIGRHPGHATGAGEPDVWIINGLGSKGAQFAPWCARHLADAILGQRPIERVIDWTRRLAP